MNLYGYVFGNPANWVDPTGLMAVGMPITPPVATGTNSWQQNANQQIADGLYGWFNDLLSSSLIYADEEEIFTDWLRQKDWADYKARYKEKPPTDLDPCEKLRWRLKHEEKLLRDRQKFDVRWSPGRHDLPGKNGAPSANEQSRRAIRNIKQKMKNIGCDEQCN